MHIHTMIPPARLLAQAPRGALVAAELFNRATLALSHLFVSRTPPRAEAQLKRAEEAAETRRMAYRVRSTDRGFAEDLFAAADRHEREAS